MMKQQKKTKKTTQKYPRAQLDQLLEKKGRGTKYKFRLIRKILRALIKKGKKSFTHRCLKKTSFTYR